MRVDISRYKLLESITLATGDCPETVSGQSRDSPGTVPGQPPVPMEGRKSLTVDKHPLIHKEIPYYRKKSFTRQSGDSPHYPYYIKKSITIEGNPLLQKKPLTIERIPYYRRNSFTIECNPLL